MFITACGYCPVRIKKLKNQLSETKETWDFPGDSSAFERKRGFNDFLQFINIMGQMRKKIAKTLQTPVGRLGEIYPDL